jgi:tetratricopeptide (TPR) repeat protein
MVGSNRPLFLALALPLTAAVFASSRPALAEEPSPKVADGASSKTDRAALFALPGEDPPQAFVPLHPRTVEEQRRIEALSQYSAARALEDRRSWSDSIALLEKALKLEPDSMAILRRLSRLCFALGRTDQAIQYGKRVLTSEPDDTDTLSRLVTFYNRKNDPSSAEALLKDMLSNPKLEKHSAGHLLAEYELGKLYSGRLQQMDKAADAFAQVVEALDEKAANRLSPSDQRRILGNDAASAYMEFGVVFMAAKRFDQAITAFRRGLVYDPENPQIPLLLGQTLLQTNKAEEAVSVVEQFLKRQPQGGEGYELLAKILTALHREKEITPRLEDAAKRDSKNDFVQYALADRYRETGQVDKAEDLYKKLLSTQPTAAGYGALSASLLKRHRTDDLLRVLSEALSKPGGVDAIAPQLKVLETDPKYADELLDAGLKLLTANPPGLEKNGMIILAHIATRAGRLEKLLALQRLVLQQNPSPQVYRETIKLLDDMHKYDEAAVTVEQLMDKYPDEKNARMLVILAQLRRLAGKNEPALQAIREAMKLEPNDSQATRLLAILLSQTGKLDESIEVLRGVLKTDPADHDINQLLGGLLSQFGRNDEAIAFYKGLIDHYPKNEEVVRLARSGLSVVYTNMGEYAKGEAELEKLLEKFPDEAGVNNDLGYLYADQGKNLEKAEAMIRKAVQEEPENSAYLDSLGWVLFKRGKTKEAAEALEKAIKHLTGSGDATIHEHLGDVYFQLQETAKAKAAWDEAKKAAEKSVPPDKRLPEILKKLASLEKLGASPKPAANDSP